MEYVDGRQIFVGLVNEVSFDTTKTSGEFTLDFETIELPYFESIGYSTDLEKESGNLNKWGIPDKTRSTHLIKNVDTHSMTLKWAKFTMVVQLK